MREDRLFSNHAQIMTLNLGSGFQVPFTFPVQLGDGHLHVLGGAEGADPRAEAISVSRGRDDIARMARELAAAIAGIARPTAVSRPPHVRPLLWHVDGTVTP